MKRVLFFVLLLLVNLVSGAQNRSISGTVKDAETKDPLIFCNVVWLHTNQGVVTNSKGQFKIDVPADQLMPRLTLSYLGYETDTIQVSSSVNEYNILLVRKQDKLNEVVVTGVSKASLARENPVTIVTVSQSEIEQTIEDNTIDAIAKNAPGLEAVKTGPNISKPFINGEGYNRVLTLYDGVLRIETQQWGDEHGVPMDDYIMEKAEVVEGPASLMYGSDAIAGVLSLFTSIPKDTDKSVHGKFLSEYQTNNGLIGNSLSLSYGNAHWSFAVRGSERVAKNYSDPIDGRVYNTGFKMGNGSAFIGYHNSHGYSHLNFTIYDNRQGIPDGSRDSLTRKFTYQVYESQGENTKLVQVDTVTNRPFVPNNILNSYNVSPLSQRIQDYRIYTDNSYRLGQGNINAMLGYEQNNRREYDHPTDVDQAGEYIVLKTVDYGLRYNTPSFFNIEPAVGVGGMYQTNTNKNATDFPIPDYQLFDIGGFVYAKWKHARWTLAGGVRYDHRNENGEKMFVKVNPVTGFYEQVPLSDSAGASQPFSPFSLRFQGVTGGLGATYRLNEQLSFKVNVARGYRSPNITEIASNGLDPGAHIYYIGNLVFKPEFNVQEDIGIIGTFTNVSFSASAFDNFIQNYIYEDQKTDENGNPVVIIPGNKTFQYQQTNAMLWGINATLNVHPVIWKAFHYDNTFSLVYAYNLNPKYKDAGVNGEYLPFIPPPHWLSRISYDFPVNNKIISIITLKAETDYNAAQNRYLGLYDTETPTSAYALLNGSVDMQIRYAKHHVMQFMFAVNNIFNTAYQSHLSRLQYFEYYTQSPNGHLGIYNMGRNICIKLILPF